ncbi:MAG TPA: HAD-IA family hydrolase [Blastocatellia bacterium]|jgi:pyrophosphatase PpaX|nr:HAD-IA family hydrolase [Blastocatellia bacterium]
MKFDCFLFDFDGTLAYSEPAYRAAFLHSIERHTGVLPNEIEFSDFWNVTPHEVLRRYGEELLEEMFASFEEHYYATHHEHLIAYQGVEELLSSLKSNGANVGIVSLKPRRAGELELDIIGLRGLVGFAVWGDDVLRPKPEPDGVLRALEEFAANPATTLVIGDSPADILMGRAAGVRTAAALWGGSTRERLLAAAPDLAINSPEDFLQAIATQ